MEGHVAHMGKKRNTSRLLVGKPEAKIPIGRLKKKDVYCRVILKCISKKQV